MIVLKKVTFEINSQDQGYGLKEELSWVEASILDLNGKEICDRIIICENKRQYSTQVIILNGKNPDHHQFIKTISKGEKMAIWGRCATTGWECIIQNVKVSIVYTTPK